MKDLHLCKDHKQEWKRSEYDKNNCDYCKLEKERDELKKALLGSIECRQQLAKKYGVENGHSKT